MSAIYVDADACPVKNEVYRVAERLDLQVFVVSNAPMFVPASERVTSIVVGNAIDAADDWIVAHAGAGDIVIADDIPLASRALKQGAFVLTPKGREHTAESIGSALATREILSHLREHGAVSGGPAPFHAKDRSRFLQQLDVIARRTELR
ncbi:MAG: YaiI/YqxD family protein [Candidatus Hydrogenedentes bacterium]|nr:YaiI/YqxD family protein [Candidatus Hydrogenedentota bacterium]